MKWLTRGNLLIAFLIALVFWWFMNHDHSNPNNVVNQYVKAIILSDIRKIAFLESGDAFAFEKETGISALLILATQKESYKGILEDYKWDTVLISFDEATALIQLNLKVIDSYIFTSKIDEYAIGSNQKINGVWVKTPPSRPDLSYQQAVELARSESPWKLYKFNLKLNRVSSGWIIDAKSAKPLWHYFYPERQEYK
jgi:hypothetical protein